MCRMIGGCKNRHMHGQKHVHIYIYIYTFLRMFTLADTSHKQNNTNSGFPFNAIHLATTILEKIVTVIRKAETGSVSQLHIFIKGKN